MLLVTTAGRNSGQPRTVAVGHLEDGNDVIVAGTNGGLRPLPAWISNLREQGTCTVELGTHRAQAEARFLEGDEWKDHWSRLVERFPVYEQAGRCAGRPVPLVRSTRLSSDDTPSDD